ncbi:MAG: S41 family peptidase [Myxococcales bacterium]|nr:S41 family peptidase [Myxococcales bacterium]
MTLVLLVALVTSQAPEQIPPAADVLAKALAQHATVSTYSAVEAARARRFAIGAVTAERWLPEEVQAKAKEMLSRRTDDELAVSLAVAAWPELAEVSALIASASRELKQCVETRLAAPLAAPSPAPAPASKPSECERLVREHASLRTAAIRIAGAETGDVLARKLTVDWLAGRFDHLSTWADLALRRAIVRSFDKRSAYFTRAEAAQYEKLTADSTESLLMENPVAESTANSTRAITATVDSREGGSVLTIRFPRFYRGVSEQLRALSIDPTTAAVVLDLRGNPGGWLSEALDVAQFFTLEPVGVELLSRTGAKPMNSAGIGPGWAGPLVLVVDFNSASAAEILAGLLQDLGRAVVVGPQPTFGKGTAQNLMSVGDASLRMTTSVVRLPGGRQVECAGVTPDVLVGSAKKTERECDADDALRPLPGGSRVWPESVAARRERLAAFVRGLGDPQALGADVIRGIALRLAASENPRALSPDSPSNAGPVAEPAPRAEGPHGS